MTPIFAVMVTLVLGQAAPQGTGTAAPAQVAEPAAVQDEVVWSPDWNVGVAEAGDHPLSRQQIEAKLARWLKMLPGATLDTRPALTRAEFRRAARTSKKRYALFIDRAVADVLSIQVLDEQELAGLASLDLQCPGCDVSGWEVRLGEGMAALVDALAPILAVEAPKEEPQAEPEKAKGDASLAFQFRELGSGLKLVGVSLQVTQGEDVVCEVLSQARGRARCPDLTAGDYAWAASFSGYKAKTGQVTLAAKEAQSLPVDLEPTRVNRFSTTIRGRGPSREVTRVRLTREELEDIPGTGGDVVRAVQSLPGVARPPGLSPLIIIRGSEPDDSLFMIDGFRSSLLYHLTGQGVVENETVELLDFVPSNFSARFGRSHGGVVEVTTRDKHAEEWTRRIQTDVYAGSVFAAGPVGKNDMLWMSFRRSWIDAVLPLVSDVLPLDFTVAPRFYDYFLKWDRKLTGTGRLGFVYQGALDKVKFAIEQPPDFDPSVRGDISTLTMFHRIRPYASFRVGDWRHKSSINIQLESFDVNLAQAFKLTVETYRKSWRHEAQRKLSESMDWVVGVDHQQTTYNVFGKASGRPQEGSGPGSFARTETTEFDSPGVFFRPGAYSELRLKQGLWESLLGFRVDTDGANWAVYPQPRFLTKRFLKDKRFDLRFGLGVYSQPPRPDETVAPFGNPQLFWEHAGHVQVGGGFTNPNGFSVESSVFGKRVLDAVGNAVEQDEAAGTQGVGGLANVGLMRGYGLELLIRQRKADYPVSGFLAYTLSRSERQEREDADWRLFSFDQTHVFTAVASYKWTTRFSTGFRYRYASANPETPNLGSVFDTRTGTYIPIAGEPFSNRPPAFWQLDVRADYKILRPGWRLELYLDLQNATNRQNIEGVSYNTDFTEQEYTFGLPLIPSFGIKGVF